MKRLFFWVTIMVMLPCAVIARDTLTLDLVSALGAYPQTADGFWTQTYQADVQIESNIFRFSHTGSTDAGGGMSYWDGFTLCTSGDETDYGQQGSSDGWVTHQWGCMGGGGPNAPYLVAYWGYFQEAQDENYHSLQVDFTDSLQHQPLSVRICNHPWPYYGMQNGDGFARPFNQEGDYFALIIHGLNAQGEPTGGTIRHELAAFRNGQLIQSAAWQDVDLTPLGTVSGLFFTMETSDQDDLYGANTAVYFCLDSLRILSADTASALTRPTGLHTTEVGEDSIILAWNSVPRAEQYVLWQDSNFTGTTADTFYIFRDLRAYTRYTLSVAAIAGQDTSETASLAVQTLDLTPPSPPTNLQAETTPYSISLSWQAAEDNVGVTRYTVYLDGSPYRRTTNLSHTVTGLEPSTTYLLAVDATDAAGNTSDKATLSVTTASLSDLSSTEEDARQQVFSVTGIPLGTSVPDKPGIYIILSKQKTTKIINF